VSGISLNEDFHAAETLLMENNNHNNVMAALLRRFFFVLWRTRLTVVLSKPLLCPIVGK